MHFAASGISSTNSQSQQPHRNMKSLFFFFPYLPINLQYTRVQDEGVRGHNSRLESGRSCIPVLNFRSFYLWGLRHKDLTTYLIIWGGEGKEALLLRLIVHLKLSSSSSCPLPDLYNRWQDHEVASVEDYTMAFLLRINQPHEINIRFHSKPMRSIKALNKKSHHWVLQQQA